MLQCTEEKLSPPSTAPANINFHGRATGMSGIQLPGDGRGAAAKGAHARHAVSMGGTSPAMTKSNTTRLCPGSHCPRFFAIARHKFTHSVSTSCNAFARAATAVCGMRMTLRSR